MQIYLNLPDIGAGQVRTLKISRVEKLFNQACDTCPQNQIALLNKLLLAWKLGKIRDDEFQLQNTTHVFKIDKVLARLMYFLFKMHV